MMFRNPVLDCDLGNYVAELVAEAGLLHEFWEVR